MYATYQYYFAAFGGELPAEAFTRYARKASRYIDSETFGAAATAPESMADRLAQCCCELTDKLCLAGRIEATTGGGILSGASNDGVSESYGGASAALSEIKKEMHRSCLHWLSAPVNLMYRGIS